MFKKSKGINLMVKFCGARAKTNGHKPCRHAAMRNGRCFLHGGKSTGPRTPEGKRRSALAHTTSGVYTKAAIEERREVREIIKEAKALLFSIDNLED